MRLIILSAAMMVVVSRAAQIRDEILRQVWLGDDPFNYVDASYEDHQYPHTNILAEVIDAVLDVANPSFWIEAGSMLGGSVIKTADRVKARGKAVDIVAIDPFTGDVNMICWESEAYADHRWRFVRYERGRPRIYDRFMANVKAANHSDIIIPLVSTASVGIKAVKRLHAESRLSRLPNVIYLDSAHEAGETLYELNTAWAALTPGGVLFGDDWNWDAVKHDVERFSTMVRHDINRRGFDRTALAGRPGAVKLHNSILVYKNQWMMVKKSR